MKPDYSCDLGLARPQHIRIFDAQTIDSLISFLCFF